MAKIILKGSDLLSIGFTEGRPVGVALRVMQKNYKHSSLDEQLAMLRVVLAAPAAYINDAVLGEIAQVLLSPELNTPLEIPLRNKGIPYQIYGEAHIEQGALGQMDIAMRLPIALAGALMPDAHQGYGLPIGGVLASNNAVVPFGVGVDIGCRMCMSIYDLPISYLAGHADKLKKALNEHTRFGINASFDKPIDHEVLSNKAFSEIGIVKSLKDKARVQLGSSGGGNHFVEFGIVEITHSDKALALPMGKYVGILSHSGSRGLGATIANHYTQIARKVCMLPKEAQHLAWLDLDSEAGQEYWMAMNLAGDYASACHHQIHQRLALAIGLKPLAMVENHHNFAWKETLPNGTEAIVHRKGATPAGKGVLGIIPGSMTAPGYIVRGKGNEQALSSAAHGAGRLMSRTKALNSITQNQLNKYLQERGVTLIGGGLDEAPVAYKDIGTVMAAQEELVEILGIFKPKIVRMASE